MNPRAREKRHAEDAGENHDADRKGNGDARNKRDDQPHAEYAKDSLEIVAHHRPNSRNLEARREASVNRHPHRADPLEQGDDERNRTQHGKREQRQKPRDQTEGRNRLVNRVDISPDERRTSETSRRNQATRALEHAHRRSAHHSDHCRKEASRIQRPIGVLEDSFRKWGVHAPRHIARPSPQIARDHNPTEHGDEG